MVKGVGMVVFIEFIAKIAFWIYLACGVVMLFYLRAILMAWRERGTTLHTAEKETATSRAYHSALVMGILILVMGAVAFVDSTLAPALGGLAREELPESMLVTPPPALSPLPVTLTPVLERPTRPAVVIPPTSLPSPSPTQPPPAPACPNPKARITSPGVGAKVEGRVEIWGTVDIADLWYYKVEFAVGTNPAEDDWYFIGPARNEAKERIVNGHLVSWDTSGLSPGVYYLRLVVVDITGNYPPANICRVQVSIE
jgi:hypothetical protein